jgi:hypothetical protein
MKGAIEMPMTNSLEHIAFPLKIETKELLEVWMDCYVVVSFPDIPTAKPIVLANER